jgi:uncharacterized membrane protein YkoI
MLRFVYILLLFPFTAATAATPSMYQVLSQGDFLKPLTVMQQLEQVSGDTIVAFDMEIERDELLYEFTLVNLTKGLITESRVRAKDGVELSSSNKSIAANDLDQAQAVKMLQKKRLSFSALVAMAMDKQSGYLLEAEVDHDLAISYLELKLLTESSKNTVAFDIENLRPLPLLRWD